MKRLIYYVNCWILLWAGIAEAQIDTKPQPSVASVAEVTERQSSTAILGVERQTRTRLVPVWVAQSAPGVPQNSTPEDRSLENRPIDLRSQLVPVWVAQSAPGVAQNSTPEDRSLENRLIDIRNDRGEIVDKYNTFQPETSPGFSIFNPVGFGADNNLFFISLSYQNRTRFTRTADGEAGIGVGLGNATKSIGAELSYGIDSFGTTAGFGSGAFNIKLHRRLNDDASVAIGWNQFARLQFAGGANVPSDYPSNSYYLVGTNIFRTTEDINAPFSRVAITGGIGSGVFLRFDPRLSNGQSNRGLNVFGSVGVRIARPISGIIEWTGQDLGVGLSIAPFKDIPLVITPAIRDLAGAGDGARFILGTSIAFNF